MKKIFLHIIFAASCFTFITACSKDVKAPANAKTTATTANTSGTQTQHQSGHTCGGDNQASSGNGGGL